VSESAHSRILDIVNAAGLVVEHPPEVMDEAKALAAAPGIDDPALRDLTRLPLVTIDEETSKDLDQALFVESNNDGWTVWYAIADAAWFVRPGTALHAEALHRGATFYLPGVTVSMLPKLLSEDVISLGPDVDRRAMVFEVRLSRHGDVLDTRIVRARVRSRLKTSYDRVQAWFDGLAPLAGATPAIEASLRAFRDVGEARIDRAAAHHVVQIRRAELAIGLADAGLRFVAHTDARNDVERWNEQISLLCNAEGARLMREGDRSDDHVQPIYRVHQPPEEERVERLVRTVDQLVRRRKLDPKVWGWKPGTRKVAEWLAGLPTEGPLGRVGLAVHRQVVIALSAATFTDVPGRHVGVGAEIYARFTAPMREIVGVFVHKETWEKLGAEQPLDDADDQRLREQVIEASNRAKVLQNDLDRKVNRLALDQGLCDDLDRPEQERPERLGTVMGIQKNAVHVTLDEPPVDVKVYLEHLADGPVKRTADTLAVVRESDGHVLCEVGDAVFVRASRVDTATDRIVLTLRREVP